MIITNENKKIGKKTIQISAKTNNKSINGNVIVNFKVKVLEYKKDYTIQDIIFLLNNENNKLLSEIKKINNDKNYFSLEKDNLINLLYKTTQKDIIMLDENNIILELLETYFEFQETNNFQYYLIHNLITKRNKLKVYKDKIKNKLSIVYTY